MNKSKLEQKALKTYIAGSFFMAILGIFFGLITPSEAIMLDGLFSLVNCVMAVITLWISWLVEQPDSEHFQFGYGSFEPLINLAKGLIIGILTLFALFSSIATFLKG